MKSISFCLVPFLVLSATVPAADTGFPERFALAADRGAVLKELIPGTDDYYYYHALHLQHQGKKAELEVLLGEWENRFQQANARRNEIRNRQVLLDYGTDPAGSLEYLRNKLGVSYNHQRVTPDARPDLATSLDPALVTREAFLADALRGTDALGNVTTSGLVHVMRNDGVELTTARRRDLLNRIHRPDFPRLVAVVNDDLGTPESGGFGEFAIHGKLTVAQLEELLKLRPALLQNTNFVNAWAAKLRPAFGEDADRSREVRGAWLGRLEAFAERLAPAFNSFKAHVLYHRLVFEQEGGVTDEARLLAYLQLPRPMGYVRPEFRESEAFKLPVDLNADFAAVTGQPPVANDEGLVRSLLLAALAGAETAEKYAPYLESGWLAAVHAEARLVSGAADAAKWVSALSPGAYQALKDRVDLDFDAAVTRTWGAADDVSIDLHVKNVPKLLVKVYEINTEHVHSTTGAQVNTDLNLDGLTANSEQTHEYGEAPLQRRKRTYQFPELKGKRGVWIVEFIGGGRSSRALIRKGGLRHLVSQEASGTVVRVYDEAMKPVAKSYALMGTRRFDSGEGGLITIPFSERPGEQNVVLGDGSGFTTLERIALAGEAYELKAGFHVARESLLPGKTAKLAIRPAVLLNGRPTVLGVMERVTLTIASRTLDGIPASTVYTLGGRDAAGKPEGLQLTEDGETVVEFTVPDRLASLSFLLAGEVKALGTGQTAKLSAAGEVAVNGISVTEQTSDIHLTPTESGYVLEERGRSGEERAEREVVVRLVHRDYTVTREFTLKTDAGGMVTLGKLEGIGSVSVRSASGVERVFVLPGTRATMPGAVNAVAGVPVRLAWTGSGEPGAGDVSVLELRNGVPVRDASAAVKAGGGMVVLSGLTPGEYAVEFAPTLAATVVRVGAGTTESGHVVSAALTMELSNPAPLAITGMVKAELPARDKEAAKTMWVFRVGNAGVDTRVHVFASRYLPHFDAFESLGKDHLAQPMAMTNAWRPSLYQSARTIGEEYRYVLERRGAKHFAGNLLPRPGLLLNPWAIADTVTERQVAQAGEEAAAMTAEKPGLVTASSAVDRASAKKDEAAAGPMDPDLSFLGMQGAMAYNLRPDKDGNVAIDAAALGDRQFVRIVAVDADSAVVRDFPMAAKPLALKDLRLSGGLDPKGHFSRQDRVSLLEKDVAFEFADALTATWQSVGHLGAAHGLFYSLTSNAQLMEFSFLLNWVDLKPEEKARLYSLHASHELHFFLARKDPGFFKDVVQPFLAGKRDKTFMDHYLLGADLSGYLRPWQYSGLNALERILLARRIESERPVVVRMMKDYLDTQAKNPQRESFLFETALNGRSLAFFGKPGSGGGGNTWQIGGGEFSGGLGGGGSNGVEDGRKRAVALHYNRSEMAVNEPAMPGAPPRGGVDDGPAERFAGAKALGGLEQDEVLKEMESTVEGKDALAKLADASAPVELSAMSAADMDAKGGRGFSKQKAVEVLSRRKAVAEKAERMFRQTERTQEWAESNYYRLLIAQQTAALVPVNRFWADYAAWDGTQPFMSVHLAEAAGSFTEMVLALAALDLPFPSQVKGGKVERKENTVTLTPGGKGILFHQEIRAAEPDKEGAKLLVSQNFYRQGDRFIEQAGEKMDKFVTGEFLTGVVYGCQVVVTNPSSSRQKLEMLFQIPVGAVPVLQTQVTRSVPVVLEPYHTGTYDFQFYFPAPGKFAHYPVHLSRNFRTAASGEPFVFTVVDRLSQADKASWEYVSQNAAPGEVLTFLEQANLNTLNLDLMLWRMKDADFAKRALALLRGRHVWHAGAGSYALLHNVPEGVTDFLMHADGFLAECGASLDSPAVKIDPVERRSYQHLEYSPLVNARAHTLGSSRTILNDKLRGQFEAFVRVLGSRAQLNSEDHLAAAYYLALQDRIEEAVERFAKVEPGKVAEQAAYDYMKAWLAICQEDTATARAVAVARASYPVDHWRRKFAELGSQLDEIEGKAAAGAKEDDRDATQDRLAAQEPAMGLKLENRMVSLSYRNLAEVTVNYYPMDLEFLFSANPFVTQDTSRFRTIRPNRSEKMMLPAGGAHVFALPAEYQSANVLVEISGGGVTRAEAAYANALDVQVSEGFGRLQVRRAADKKPLAKVYVKVFAEVNGAPVFYKDGYTDLRGKFDYASLSTGDLDGATRFSILVMSEEFGATVKEVQPPKR